MFLVRFPPPFFFHVLKMADLSLSTHGNWPEWGSDATWWLKSIKLSIFSPNSQLFEYVPSVCMPFLLEDWLSVQCGQGQWIGPAVRADFWRLYPVNTKTPTCCPSDDNRTKVTNSVTSARSLWWHVGPYFWPADLMRMANPIGAVTPRVLARCHMCSD